MVPRPVVALQVTRNVGAAVLDLGDDALFVISDLEMTSRVVATLIQDLHDEFADQSFAYEARKVDMAAVERTVAGYTWAIERILGVPEDSVALDMTMLRAWFDPDQEQIEDR